MRDTKGVRKQYYLGQNVNGQQSDMTMPNYDIKEKKLVGYGHIQKTNVFHQIRDKRK